MFNTAVLFLVLSLTVCSAAPNNGMNLLNTLFRSPFYRAYMCETSKSCAMVPTGPVCQSVTAYLEAETTTGHICACENGYINHPKCDASFTNFDLCGGNGSEFLCVIQGKTCKSLVLSMTGVQTTIRMCA
jgi:hypothetical protein